MADLDVAAAQRDLSCSIRMLSGTIALAEGRQSALSQAIEDARKVQLRAAACTVTDGGAQTIRQQATDVQKVVCDLITTTSPGQALDEWKECRATIDRCDKMLVDLRKTGFGFITAIVGAATFLFGDPSGKSTIDVTDDAKAALFGMLVLLIVALYWIDVAHHTWLVTSVDRAKELEQHPLGFQLTGRISQEFAAAKAIILGFAIYLILLITTFGVFWKAAHVEWGRNGAIPAAFILGVTFLFAGLLTSRKLYPR